MRGVPFIYLLILIYLLYRGMLYVLIYKGVKMENDKSLNIKD